MMAKNYDRQNKTKRHLQIVTDQVGLVVKVIICGNRGWRTTNTKTEQKNKKI
jgi:hypothetical protein